MVHSISFQTFFVQAFKIIIDSWKLNWASVFEWHKRFKEGSESMKDDERCGRSKEVKHQSSLAKGLGFGYGHQDSSSPFLIVQMLLPVTFGYSLSSEAVVMRQLRRWKRLWWRSLTRSHKRTSMGPSRSCWNGTTNTLQLEEITSKGTRVSCVYYQEKCPYVKSLETYRLHLVCGFKHSYLILFQSNFWSYITISI